jgi:hypothetical protein
MLELCRFLHAAGIVENGIPALARSVVGRMVSLAINKNEML